VAAANVFQILNLAIIPLASAYAFTSLSTYVTGVGIEWIGFGLVELTILCVRQKVPLPQSNEVFRRIKTLLSFGTRRVGGDVALLLLQLLPATVAAHLDGLAVAGYVGLCTSATLMIGTGLGPISSVVLPRAASLLVGGNEDVLRRHSRTLLMTTGCLSLSAAIATAILSPWLIPLFLGSRYTMASPLVRLVTVSFLPYSMYVIGRSVLDAASTTAFNARNAYWALLVLLTGCGATYLVNASATWLIISFDAAMLTMGTLTLRKLAQLDLIRWSQKGRSGSFFIGASGANRDA
jgi:O-antigen/teichoic acid export membrane protein